MSIADLWDEAFEEGVAATFRAIQAEESACPGCGRTVWHVNGVMLARQGQSIQDHATPQNCTHYGDLVDALLEAAC